MQTVGLDNILPIIIIITISGGAIIMSHIVLEIEK